MRVGQVFFACSLSLTVLSPAVAQERPQSIYRVASIVILPLRTTGNAKPETAQVLDDLLASAVHERTRGVHLIDAHEAAATLPQRGHAEALHCMALACWAAAGRAAEVDSVVVGTLGALHGRHLLTLHWIASRDASAIDRHTEVLGDDPSTFPSFTQRAVRALLRRANTAPEPGAPEPPRPSVSLSTLELCQSEDVTACARGKACDGGDAAACAAVARWFEDGVHVARDVGRAVAALPKRLRGRHDNGLRRAGAPGHGRAGDGTQPAARHDPVRTQLRRGHAHGLRRGGRCVQLWPR